MHEIQLFPRKNNKLAFLTRTLEVMSATIDAYADYSIRAGSIDVPYQYNERATLSILAGAIWRSDPANLVLEEFRTDKAWTESSYKGRQDIWFSACDRECYGEAKQQWTPLFRLRADVGSLLSVLGTETDAAKQNMPAQCATCSLPVGILFVVPYITKARIAHARKNLSEHYGILSNTLETWSKSCGFEVLWGKYSRDELLEEAGCYSWSDGREGSCPSLDTLLCTPK